MAPEARARIEAPGAWTRNPYTEPLEDGFSNLKKFSLREGHTRVWEDYKADGRSLLGLVGQHGAQ